MSELLTAQFVVARSEFNVEIELQLNPGEVLALMGPSGAGKSTIVSAIAGIERITTGQIRLGTKLLADAQSHLPPHRRAVGLLGQNPRLFPHLSAGANIAFGARAAGLSKLESAEIAAAWLKRLGLEELAEQRPAALSGGQCQRIALARALAAAPNLLLIDEPFASLDVEAAADMRSLVRAELDRTGMTAIVVSHSAADAVALAAELAVIERGQLVQQGPVWQVLKAPETRFVRAVAATLPAGDFLS